MSRGRRRFFGPSFSKPLDASIMKMPRAAGGFLLVEHDEAGGDAGAVEEVRGQADDRLDVAALDQGLANRGLGVASEQHAVGHDSDAAGRGLQRLDHVQQEGVVTVLVGRSGEAIEAAEVLLPPVRPRLDGEWRIGDEVVERHQVARRPRNSGLVSVFPWRMSLVALPWRIMFIRASAQVALSFS